MYYYIAYYKSNGVWLPGFFENISDAFLIGNRGQTGILKIPTKNGCIPDKYGLQYNLRAIRIDHQEVTFPFGKNHVVQRSFRNKMFSFVICKRFYDQIFII